MPFLICSGAAGWKTSDFQHVVLVEVERLFDLSRLVHPPRRTTQYGLSLLERGIPRAVQFQSFRENSDSPVRRRLGNFRGTKRCHASGRRTAEGLALRVWFSNSTFKAAPELRCLIFACERLRQCPRLSPLSNPCTPPQANHILVHLFFIARARSSFRRMRPPRRTPTIACMPRCRPCTAPPRIRNSMR